MCCFSVTKALNSAEHALLSGDEDKLYDTLRSPALGLKSVQAPNKGWYLKQLLADREQKEQVTGSATQWGENRICQSHFGTLLFLGLYLSLGNSSYKRHMHSVVSLFRESPITAHL